MNRVGWALALTCLLALGGLSGTVASCASTAHAGSQGYDPANATAPADPDPADATSDATPKPGCNAVPFVLPLIGILGLVWLRMKKTMK